MSLNTHLLFCVRRNFHQITQRKSTLKSAPIILPALWSLHQRGSSFLVNGEYHHSDICNNNLIIGINVNISALLVTSLIIGISIRISIIISSISDIDIDIMISINLVFLPLGHCSDLRILPPPPLITIPSLYSGILGHKKVHGRNTNKIHILKWKAY